MTIVYILTILFGGITGFFMEKMTVSMISKRTKGDVALRFSGSIKNTVIWVVLNSLGWFFTVLTFGLSPKTIECVLLLSTCIMLSAVDINIKKIPNELILSILVISVVFVIIEGQLGSIKANLIGLAVGFAIFFLPALIGRGAGWGDVKYAAVVGFCLGAFGFLTAIIVMTLVLFVYTGYMMMTHKGGLKTKIALGPFMASGFVSVMMLNIINSNQMLFDLGVLLNQGIR